MKEDTDRDGGFTFKLDGETRSCASAQGIWRLMMQGWRLADTHRFDELMDVLTSRETAPAGGGGFEPGEPPAA